MEKARHRQLNESSEEFEMFNKKTVNIMGLFNEEHIFIYSLT